VAKTIWIDLENAPHVPFFVPVILELERRGFAVFITARDFGQTRELVEKHNLTAHFIGREQGSNPFKKTFGVLFRTYHLIHLLSKQTISLAVGHGSRGLVLASKVRKIPSLTLYDYEGASVTLFNRLSTYVMAPELIPFEVLRRLKLKKVKHLTYPGLKEEIYIADHQFNPKFPSELGLDLSKVIVTVRPPSDTAHYRNNSSALLFEEIMQLLSKREDVQLLITPRTKAQEERLQSAPWLTPNMIVLNQAVNGIDLLWHSDLLIGGGGTMNREAAVLGTPVLSIFKGPTGAVDQWLFDQKKMHEINAPEEILPFLKKTNKTDLPQVSTAVRNTIIDTIIRLA